MTRVIIVDCYDSFTYNLFHYFDSLEQVSCKVVRYNEVNWQELSSSGHVVLSPGPGLPKDYPELLQFLKHIRPKTSVLGICLGMQCINEAFGGKLQKLKDVLHGVVSINHVESSNLHHGVPSSFNIGHYHSWVVDETCFPENVFDITSRNEDGLIMSMEHKEFNICGIQYHPESVMTEYGIDLLKNWLSRSS